jgi:hypothetical protein
MANNSEKSSRRAQNKVEIERFFLARFARQGYFVKFDSHSPSDLQKGILLTCFLKFGHPLCLIVAQILPG